MLTVGKKAVYLLVGLTAVILGLIGIVLPGLPTVPFILVALWAFSNSSERLHKWLQHLPFLKEVHREIDLFQQQRSLSMRTKIIAQSTAWASCILSILLIRNIWLSAILALAAFACTVFMMSISTRISETE